MKKKNQFKLPANSGSRPLLSTAVLEPTGSTILLKSPTLKRRDRDDCCHVVGKGTPTASHKNSPLSGGGQTHKSSDKSFILSHPSHVASHKSSFSETMGLDSSAGHKLGTRAIHITQLKPSSLKRNKSILVSRGGPRRSGGEASLRGGLREQHRNYQSIELEIFDQNEHEVLKKRARPGARLNCKYVPTSDFKFYSVSDGRMAEGHASGGVCIAEGSSRGGGLQTTSRFGEGHSIESRLKSAVEPFAGVGEGVSDPGEELVGNVEGVC